MLSEPTKSILQVASYSPTYSGNFMASLRAAAKECRARGYRTIWVFPARTHTREWFKAFTAQNGGSAYSLSNRGSLIADADELSRIARRENAEIIHTHFSTYDISAWIARGLCLLESRNVRVVWHVHSAFTDLSPLRRAKDFVKLGIFGRSCRIVPVSGAIREAVVERGCPASRTHVIDNGIDVAHATARRTTRELMHKTWNISAGSLVLLGFGWTPFRKGVDTMLEALSNLLRDGMNLTLVLAGTEELRKFVDRWPDRECVARVRIIPPAEYIGDLFAASDIFLSPSRAEGWCYGVAESMANQIPAIAADIPSLSWARNGPGVYFCRPGNSDSLTSAIRHVIALSAAEKKLSGESAKDFVTSGFTAECWGRNIWGLYEQILALPSRPPLSLPVAG